MSSTTEIPIFPLGSVLFPAGLLQLRIFEPRYLAMTARCLEQRSVFGVTLIRGGYEVGQPAIPCELGCTARILEHVQPGPDFYLLKAQGETRFRIRRRWTLESGLIMASVDYCEPPDPVPVPEAYRGLAETLGSLMAAVGAEHFPQPARLEDAAWVGNRLAELLPLKPERRQQLLEQSDPLAVLAELAPLLAP